MSDFYYTVDWYVVQKHKRSGKILREGWQSNAGPYDTLEEAKADNPPDKNPGELSCQERSEIEGGTQLLATNMAVASLILGRVQKTIVNNESPEETEIFFDLGIGMSEPYNRTHEYNNTPITV